MSSANAVRLRVYTAMGKGGRRMEFADTAFHIEGIEEKDNRYMTHKKIAEASHRLLLFLKGLLNYAEAS